jgi:hypothetical protein
MYCNNPVRRVSSPGFDPQPADADRASVFVTVRSKATGSADTVDARYRTTTLTVRLGYRF